MSEWIEKLEVPAKQWRVIQKLLPFALACYEDYCLQVRPSNRAIYELATEDGSDMITDTVDTRLLAFALHVEFADFQAAFENVVADGYYPPLPENLFGKVADNTDANKKAAESDL